MRGTPPPESPLRLALAAVLLATLPSTAAAPAPLTPRERSELLAALEGARERLLRELDDLSDRQWRFKPAPDRWSVAEVAEHVVMVEQDMLRLVTTDLLATPVVEPDPQAERVTARIREESADRSREVPAAERVLPTGRWPDRKALIRAFKRTDDSLREFIRKTPAPIREHRLQHPAFGALDGYQWVVLLAAHTDRHVQQVAEVKRSAGYPAK